MPLSTSPGPIAVPLKLGDSILTLAYQYPLPTFSHGRRFLVRDLDFNFCKKLHNSFSEIIVMKISLFLRVNLKHDKTKSRSQEPGNSDHTVVVSPASDYHCEEGESYASSETDMQGL